MRDPHFDLVTAIAQPGFTPALRDAEALVILLEQIDPEDAKDLTGRKSHRESIQRHATRGLVALRGAGRDAIVRRLVATLEDGAATRLIAALGAIARSGDAVATRAVLPLVTAPRERWRRAAIVALGKLGGDAARGSRIDAAIDEARDASIDDARAAIDEARAAIVARWDGADIGAAERRALTEALGKLGGGDAEHRLLALRPGDDHELERRRDRALLMSRRDQLREPLATPASIAASDAVDAGSELRHRSASSSVNADARVPDMDLVWSCRTGLSSLLAEELGALGYRVLHRGSEAVRTRFAGPLRAAFASRLWTHLGLQTTLAAGELPAAIVETMARPALRQLLVALTHGRVRWRLEFASGGPRRALIWQAVRDLAARAPELVNEPADTTWTMVVDSSAQTLLLRPRRLEDPRFAWRVAELPASSHPTVAAAIAAMAKPRGGEQVWDPFCGSGSELIECAIWSANASAGSALDLLGSDLDRDALQAATRNAAAAGVKVTLECADARVARPTAVDLIVSNPPLGGRLRGDAGQLLCEAVLGFAATLRPGGRLVWMTPAPRRTTAVAQDAGLLLDRAFDVDLGGMRARLERWRKPS